MNVKAFHYVQTLAQTRNFSRAAQLLCVSQPALSQYIRSVEQELDAPLFDRTGADVVLTDAGRAYLETGRQILALEEQLRGQISDLRESRTGTLRVGTSLYRGTCLMPEVLAAFRKRYPGVTVILEEMLQNDLTAAAGRGELDLIVTALPLSEQKFAYHPLFEEQLLLAAPAAASVTTDENGAVDAAVLGTLPLVCLDSTQRIQGELERIAAVYGLMLHTVCECRNIVTQLALVQEQVGCALVPGAVTRLTILKTGIRFYPFRQALPTRQMVVAYDKKRYLSKAAQELITLLTEER